MKPIDQDSFLNRTNLFLKSRPGSVMDKSMTSTNILNAIQNAPNKIPPKPWIPKSYCQYPNQPRIDDFDVNKGLGHVSLQPTIDALNQYKQIVIANIKSCLAAMGPDGAKDAKLASQITIFVKQVYDAASCFSQMVKNINNLVTTYLVIINLVISDTIQKISQLEQQILYIKRAFDPQRLTAELVKILTIELINDLNISTDVFSTLNAVNKLLNQIALAQQQVHSLFDAPNRILLNMEAQLSNLQAMCNQFKYFLQLLGVLNSNHTRALGMKINDDFLDDFDYNSTQSGDYWWSLTNSGALINYNTTDDFGLLKTLTTSCRAYKSGLGKPLLIDSRNIAGTIIVPSDGDGLISGALDATAPQGIALLYQLSINSGATIIQALLTPTLTIGSDGTPVGVVIGNYVTKETQNFKYMKLETTPSGTWKLYLVNPTDANNIQIGDWFYNNSYWADTTTGIDLSVTDNLAYKYDVPLHPTTIIVDIDPLTSKPRIIPKSTWFTSTNGYNIPLYLENPVPLGAITLPGDGWYNAYIPVDPAAGLPTYYYSLMFEVVTVNSIFVEVKIVIPYIDELIKLPTGVNRWDYIQPDPIQTKPPMDTKENIVFTMGAYSLIHQGSVPHTGEKIPCKNWSLTILPVLYEGEDVSLMHHLAFYRIQPSDIMSLIFLKCRFGFIPDQK